MVGTTELIIILAVAILIFGPSQIPRLMKMIADGVRELRKAGGGDDAH